MDVGLITTQYPARSVELIVACITWIITVLVNFLCRDGNVILERHVLKEVIVLQLLY